MLLREEDGSTVLSDCTVFDSERYCMPSGKLERLVDGDVSSGAVGRGETSSNRSSTTTFGSTRRRVVGRPREVVVLP